MDYKDLYIRKRPEFEALSSRIELLLESILQEQRINYHIIESRTKEIDSFLEKIERKNNKYSDPIAEMTDLSGIRIICYYQDDVEKIDKILFNEFSVDKENSIDKGKILKSNEFGYLSYHYVCTINPSRANLPEWKSFSKLKFEIQVRTVLQHAWASISHEIEYKSDIEIPSLLKRKLFRLAGLIELADEEFKQIRDKHLSLHKIISGKANSENKNITQELNLLTLKELLKPTSKNIISKIVDSANKAGFKIKGTSNQESLFTQILRITDKLSIKTVDSFLSFLEENISDAEKYFATLLQGNKGWGGSIEFTVLMFIMQFIDENALEETRIGWTNDIWRGTLNAIKEYKKSAANNV